MAEIAIWTPRIAIARTQRAPGPDLSGGGTRKLRLTTEGTKNTDVVEGGLLGESGAGGMMAA